MKNSSLLEIQDLKKYFIIEKKARKKKNVFLKAVDGISLRVHEEEVLGLVGESGSGKSTVAYTVIGMYKPTSGNIVFRGRNIEQKSENRPKDIKKELQIVFQDPSTSLNPRRSIRRILERPLKVHSLTSRKEIENEIVKLLEMVELPPQYMYKYPLSIGGGERQLVSIARALATKPRLLILDEPTSALDVSVQGKIINTLIHLRKKMKLSYLLITHDLSLMRNVSDRIAIMYLGKICEIAATKEFFETPRHPYTKMLLSSVPVISREEEAAKPDRIRSEGEIPSPVNIPAGCAFNTRCPHVKEICCKVDPVFTELSPDHTVRCHLYS